MASGQWRKIAITGRRMNAKGTHIEQVEYRDVGENVSAAKYCDRKAMIKFIDENGDEAAATAYKNDAGRWAAGADVFVIQMKTDRFLKTDRDGTERDNLDKLPTF